MPFHDSTCENMQENASLSFIASSSIIAKNILKSYERCKTKVSKTLRANRPKLIVKHWDKTIWFVYKNIFFLNESTDIVIFISLDNLETLGTIKI